MPHDFRRRPLMRSTAAVVLMALVTTSCAEVTSSGVQAPARSFTGEELYRGTVLMTGPVADAVPQIRQHLRMRNFVDDAGLERIEATNARLVRAIRSIDPGFFERYRTEVTSGDHIRVVAAMRQAGQITMQALSTFEDLRVREALGNRDAILSEATRRHAGAEGETRALDAEQARRALNMLYTGAVGGPGEDANALWAVAVLWLYYGGFAVDVLLVSNYGVVIAIEVYFGVDNPFRMSNGNVAVLHEQVVEGIATGLRN